MAWPNLVKIFLCHLGWIIKAIFLMQKPFKEFLMWAYFLYFKDPCVEAYCHHSYKALYFLCFGYTSWHVHLYFKYLYISRDITPIDVGSLVSSILSITLWMFVLLSLSQSTWSIIIVIFLENALFGIVAIFPCYSFMAGSAKMQWKLHARMWKLSVQPPGI